MFTKMRFANIHFTAVQTDKKPAVIITHHSSYCRFTLPRLWQKPLWWKWNGIVRAMEICKKNMFTKNEL